MKSSRRSFDSLRSLCMTTSRVKLKRPEAFLDGGALSYWTGAAAGGT